jgi:hypothetical protein
MVKSFGPRKGSRFRCTTPRMVASLHPPCRVLRLACHGMFKTASGAELLVFEGPSQCRVSLYLIPSRTRLMMHLLLPTNYPTAGASTERCWRR